MRGRVRPSRAMGVVGMIVTPVVMFAGLAMMSSASGEGLGPPGAFVFAWIVAGLAVTGLHAYWAFGKQPQGLYEIDLESSDRDSGSMEERIRRLERIHSQGLISDAEYERKRAELIAEL